MSTRRFSADATLKEWALDIERRIDRGESPSKRARKEVNRAGIAGGHFV